MRHKVNFFRASQRESGQSLVMVALFLLLVGVPVIVLAIDGTRLYRAQSLLQTATDAACEDAAVTAPDYEYYKRTGKTRFVSNQLLWYRAYQTYNRIWKPYNRAALDVGSYSITISPDQGRGLMDCTGHVSVPLVILPTTITLDASSASSIRFSSD